MATGTYISSGSPCIGSPITVTMMSDPIVGEVSFHRVKVVVRAGLNDPANEQSDIDFIETEMSEPVGTAENTVESVTLDVSSALRAVADKYVFSPTPPLLNGTPLPYPTVRWQLKIYDEYMVNGSVAQGTITYLPAVSSYYEGIFGEYTELERMAVADIGFRTSQLFSRKPTTTPEIVAVGESVVLPMPFEAPLSLNEISSATKSVVRQIETEGVQDFGYVDEGEQVPLARHSVYSVPSAKQTERFQLRFVNSMGCLESFGVQCIPSCSIDSETTVLVRSLPETFGSPSGHVVSKKPTQEEWNMATGPMDEAWRTWFVHDVLGSKHVWLLVDGNWLPCSLSADNITLFDRANVEMLGVTFKLKFDLAGSPKQYISI